ncbi:MAG: MotA/TolQ/ExbB proton channel family protein [Oligoflexia bacterium]|nr:MotA/TolQ/ExbB proton channel family protein [Oligoflexia bacterium]
MGLFALFKDGGFVMYPLLICSLVAWAVIFEKWWGLGKFKREYLKLHAKAVPLIKNGKMEEAKGLYAGADPLISAPHLALFEASLNQEALLNKELIEKKVYRRFIETQMGLKRFLWILGTVGAMAPFIGLFGTVAGIIRSFESISETGKSGFSVVAQGLAEALIATASGILVAVVAVIFYNYFQVRINVMTTEFKNRIDDLADTIFKA